jgi:hypothetical protein
MKLTVAEVDERVGRLGEQAQLVYRALDKLLKDADGVSDIVLEDIVMAMGKSADAAKVKDSLTRLERAKLIFTTSHHAKGGKGTVVFFNTFAHAHGLTKSGKTIKQSAETVGNIFTPKSNTTIRQETTTMSNATKSTRKASTKTAPKARKTSSKPKGKASKAKAEKSSSAGNEEKRATILAAIKGGASTADELVKRTKLRLQYLRPLAMEMAKAGEIDAQKVGASWRYAPAGKLKSLLAKAEG